MDEKDNIKKEEKINIEVELKFQPGEEELSSMLNGAERLSDEKIRDVYYDFRDFILLKEGTRLRFRSIKEEGRELKGYFELKVKIDSKSDIEITNEKEIEEYLEGYDVNLKEYFKSGKDLSDLMKDKKLEGYIDFKTDRKKYRKDGYNIDVDELDFGYNMCEIEKIIDNKEDIVKTREDIKEFAKEHNFDVDKKIIPKGWEYLRRFKSELYEELYLKKNEVKDVPSKEIKMR